MKKAETDILSDYFEHYTHLVKDLELIEALEITGKPMFEQETDQLVLLGHKVYSPGKWTVNDIIQHLIDNERIFAYRALRFAREDKTPLPGYDENKYVISAGATKRHLNDLLGEFFLVRETSILLFKSFSQTQIQSEGICNNNKRKVLALGYAIAGHGRHHMNIIRERYYPLIN